MSPEELDSLPYGAIRLDKTGKILSYNSFEEKLAGRSASRVVGKNFFTKVAPCTNVKEFRGAFQDLVDNKSETASFDFTFTFSPPMNVHINMMADRNKEVVWILVEREKE